MMYSVFSKRHRGIRMMHAVTVGTNRTVCELSVGLGSGLVRDGDYSNNIPCPVCWKRGK